LRNTIPVELREPFPAWAWPTAWTWIEPHRARAMGDRMPQDRATFVEHQMGLTAWRTFGVWRAGELGGFVTLEPASPGIWSIHIVLKPAFFGCGARAAGMAIERLFESDKEARKVISVILTTNLLCSALGRRLGFQREALLREHVMAGGKPADLLIFGLLRGEWHGISEHAAGRPVLRDREPAADHQDDQQLGHVDGHVHIDVQPEPDRVAVEPVPVPDERPKRRRRRRDG
jgi:RimJ/RimL family protein N-acetyltransferase